MPPSNTSSSGGPRRRILAGVLIAIVMLGAYAFIHLGTFLAREDRVTKADAIFVLAGTELDRSLEGVDLFLEGYAPRLVMSREQLEPAFAAIGGRGIALPSEVERARDAAITLGVPAGAIVLPDRLHGSTASEAITLRSLAQEHHWRTVIVVSSKFHLRRARFAMLRELRGTGVQVLMRGTRYDNARPEQWWRQRGDIRDILAEVPKFAAYALGLGA